MSGDSLQVFYQNVTCMRLICAPRGLPVFSGSCALLHTCQDDWLLGAGAQSPRPSSGPCDVHCLVVLSKGLWQTNL